MPSDLSAELARYAEAARRKSGVRCLACGLPKPVLAAVEAARKKGTPYRILSEWLEKKGHALSLTAVQRHLTQHAK